MNRPGRKKGPVRKILVLVAAVLFSLAAVSPALLLAAGAETLQILPKPGERVVLDVDHYFTYGFDKPPKMGAAIMRVEIFSRTGERDTTFVVRGDADMPSMRGAHSTGDKDFALSAKGVYLLPVRLVMPGDWEITFTFLKDGKKVFRGAYLFDL